MTKPSQVRHKTVFTVGDMRPHWEVQTAWSVGRPALKDTVSEIEQSIAE